MNGAITMALWVTYPLYPWGKASKLWNLYIIYRECLLSGNIQTIFFMGKFSTGGSSHGGIVLGEKSILGGDSSVERKVSEGGEEIFQGNFWWGDYARIEIFFICITFSLATQSYMWRCCRRFVREKNFWLEFFVEGKGFHRGNFLWGNLRGILSTGGISSKIKNNQILNNKKRN